MTATTEPYGVSPQRRTLDGGRLLAALGALAVLISLFLDWYGRPGSPILEGGAADDGISAWTSFELIDVLLAALALTTIAWAMEAILFRSERPLVPPRFGTVAGPIALTLILVSIINEPPALAGFDPTREAGAWIALAGAVVITIGGLLTIARVSVVVAARERGAEPPGSRAARAETETRPLSGESPGRQPPGL